MTGTGKRTATLLVAISALILGLTLAPAAGAATIAAYPSPGTKFASPNSRIAFADVTKAELGRVVVRGSRTGRHRGHVRAWGGPTGVSFVPARPFAARETVTVISRRHSFHGTGGRHRFAFSTAAFLPKNQGNDPWSPRRGQTPPRWTSFRTLPLKVPRIDVRRNLPGTSAGNIFFAPRTSGPTILDSEGRLVYYRPGLRVTDFRAQNYQGKPILTWWRRDTFGRRVDSKFEMADSHYRVFKRLTGGNGYIGDPHEFNLTPRGTAYITAIRVAIVNMSRFGGPKQAPVLDYIAQEIDLKTNLVVWEWHPLGQVRLNESYLPITKRLKRSFDFFHANSVNDDSDGNILISARHTQALYKINRKTGDIMWRMGGKRSDFKLGPGVRFGFQHDVQRQADGTLTVFDNGAGGVHGKVNDFTSAKALEVDEGKRLVTLAQVYPNPRPVISGSQGNTEVMPNGNVFVGWGSHNACTEFAPDGRVLFDFTFSAKTVSYRCFKAPWVGAPRTPIAVKSQAAGSGSKVWMSWNGDNRVRTWRVLAGATRGKLQLVGSVPRSGFESVAPLDGRYRFYRVVGLSGDGRILGRSAINPIGELTR